MFVKDTIAAISTPLGEGAIGIVRLSGDQAIEIANEVFQGKDLRDVPSHTIHYGHIVDPASLQSIDEVMVSVMQGPRSFTCEDVVEINCHGGVVGVQRILDLLLRQGARLAEAGEFTKRAFLNGRIDLSQAEAVMDLIQAKTSQAMDASMRQLEGSLSARIRNIRQIMVQTLAQVEVTIDYPEYDQVEEISLVQLKESAQAVIKELQSIMRQAQRGKLYRQGLQTVIIGRPNVGKSSLLNLLTGEDTAIVTEIAGTTRDTIEEQISVRGIPLNLIDTAGIRQTEDIVEQIGVEKSFKMMDQADLIILLLNGAEDLTADDRHLLDQTQGHKRVILLNKVDLAAKTQIKDLAPWAKAEEIIQTSTLEEAGIESLEDRIEDLFFQGELEGKDVNYLLNSRHVNLLNQAIQALEEVLEAVDLDLPVDLIQIDYTHAWDLLGEITGDSVQDELIDTLFSQFCLGK